MPGILSVTKDELRQMDTSSTPAFLGLSDPGGLWEQLGGVGSAGDGIIIGLIDSGIWPESLSFTDRTGVNGSGKKGGKLDYHQIPGWHGKCTPGEAFNASMCNQKLIGAQWFNASVGRRRRDQPRSARGSSTRCATTTVTAPTRRPPRVGTTVSR